MTKHRITAVKVVLVLSLLAGVGLFIPGSPAYLPALLVHYSHTYSGHSLGYWMRALDAPEPAVRRKAIFSLGAMNADAAEAVPALARILTEDADGEIRYQAALALSKIAPAAIAALPALARALDEDESPKVRMNAAIALCRLGPQARPAAAVLIRALERRANRTNLAKYTCTIQEMASVALGRATAGTTEGVAALTTALGNARTSSKRRFLAQALGDIGASAQAAASRLQSLLDDDSPEVRESAAEALRKILGE
jgi:HEAT repeat protein